MVWPYRMTGHWSCYPSDHLCNPMYRNKPVEPPHAALLVPNTSTGTARSFCFIVIHSAKVSPSSAFFVQQQAPELGCTASHSSPLPSSTPSGLFFECSSNDSALPPAWPSSYQIPSFCLAPLAPPTTTICWTAHLRPWSAIPSPCTGW